MVMASGRPRRSRAGGIWRSRSAFSRTAATGVARDHADEWGRGLPEDLAKRRLYISGLPGMAEENKREHDCFTLHAADLLLVESPWRGTPNSPLILLETPYRQLVPFSPLDAALSDANMLITAKSGGGKTFMAKMFLTMMARLNPLISILERGIRTGRWSS